MKRTFALLAIGALGLTACGGDGGSGSSSADTSGGSAAEATQPGDDTSAPSATDSPSAPGAAGAGSCQVQVSGGETASWEAGQDASSVLVDYWLSDDARDILGGSFGFILNCPSDTGYVGFLAGDLADGDTLPMAPGTYALPTADDGVGSGFVVGALFDLSASELVWGLTGGALEITEFDMEHIAGTFQFEVRDVLSGISGDEPAENLTVTGSFDFANLG